MVSAPAVIEEMALYDLGLPHSIRMATSKLSEGQWLLRSDAEEHRERGL